MDFITPFGMRDGRLLTAEDVPSGLACACTCPGCGTPLVAKKGDHKRWHFSHYRVQPSVNCVESAIHMAAKQVLLDHCGLVVPEVSFEISAKTVAGETLHERDVLSPNRRIRFDRTAAEIPFDDVRPDVVGYRGERQLLIEIYFRHRVDDVKREKLVALGLPAIEIDLSDLDPMGGFEAITQRVIESTEHKEWLVYPGREEHQAYLEQRLQDRITAINEARAEVLRQLERAEVERAERKRLVLLEREARQQAQKAAEEQFDWEFADWTEAAQKAWLQTRLGLKYGVPAFLCKRAQSGYFIGKSEFLWQASIFERFIYRKGEGAKFTPQQIYECLCRRFKLTPQNRPDHTLVATRYLEYLVRAGFLHRIPKAKHDGPYYVRHDDTTMPPWSPAATRFDGEPELPDQARGSGPLRRWCSKWPRWRGLLEEAEQLLTGSPYRDLLIEGLNGLSAMSPPATPNHWAAPIVERGVPLEDCFALLTKLGLMPGERR